MSQPTCGIPPFVVNLLHKRTVTIAEMAGLHGQLFWFRYLKLSHLVTMEDLPCLTAEDEVHLVSAEDSSRVVKTVIFGEICVSEINSTMIAPLDVKLTSGIMVEWS